ncbi:Xaa-Pro aminopeptidase [Paucidesulfovibrio gracilis DSM 16080]|uniref:Xaa-Pro aminopeptidase n=1 Tax=Paucidesulfovibrio gracilis DSM 16080 TaxID=1121449 RepID=A0A1T4XQG8_9BACT|nr:Xaa-Pro peptidase family protein [Paucidesulfovibrio gracilis]SKA91603.1 Xaa-Pro aminopeptidase [Paucidesulfovibrio gracilis DSM 16080]
MTNTNTIYQQRREALRKRLSEKGLNALLVSHAANRYYLSGFELHDSQCNESAGWLVVTDNGTDYLLTDPRYEDAAKRCMPEENVFIYSGKKFEQVGPFLKGLNLGSLGFEPKAMSLFDHEKLRDYVQLTATENLVEDLRLIKDADEIERMRAACALNHRVFRALEDSLRPGQTEVEVAWNAERMFREWGASELAFSTIVGVGPNAALPHAIPGNTTLKENELVLIDMGCRLNDYCSDQTRTFWVGENRSERFRNVREMVRTAQQKAIDAIRPGMTFAEAYGISRGYFEEQNVAEFFTHALGHGIGLETHEPPSLSPLGTGVLQPGMIVTVEPGLYWPDWGGVRWEHMIVITEDGCETL